MLSGTLGASATDPFTSQMRVAGQGVRSEASVIGRRTEFRLPHTQERRGCHSLPI